KQGASLSRRAWHRLDLYSRNRKAYAADISNGRRKTVRPAAANTGDVSRLRFELQVRRLASDADHCIWAERQDVCLGRFELQFVRRKRGGPRVGFGDES